MISNKKMGRTWVLYAHSWLVTRIFWRLRNAHSSTWTGPGSIYAIDFQQEQWQRFSRLRMRIYEELTARKPNLRLCSTFPRIFGFSAIIQTPNFLKWKIFLSHVKKRKAIWNFLMGAKVWGKKWVRRREREREKVKAGTTRQGDLVIGIESLKGLSQW